MSAISHNEYCRFRYHVSRRVYWSSTYTTARRHWRCLCCWLKAFSHQKLRLRWNRSRYVYVHLYVCVCGRTQPQTEKIVKVDCDYTGPSRGGEEGKFSRAPWCLRPRHRSNKGVLDGFFLASNMHKIHFRPWLRHRTLLGELTTFPGPIIGWYKGTPHVSSL